MTQRACPARELFAHRLRQDDEPEMMRSLNQELLRCAGLLAVPRLVGIAALVAMSSGLWERRWTQPPPRPAGLPQPTASTPLRAAIQTLMEDLGADADHRSMPPEFVAAVERFVRRYQGPDRAHITRALVGERQELAKIRRLIRDADLHPDLALVVLVESSFLEGQSSSAGAAGLWQFTPGTARAFGLRMNKDVAERHDALKSTRAACQYFHELMRRFGGEESVMLALAAYNLGSSRLSKAIGSHLSDDASNETFWAVYRSGALPEETREYVPKVIAAMLICRDPARFGIPAGPLDNVSGTRREGQATTTEIPRLVRFLAQTFRAEGATAPSSNRSALLRPMCRSWMDCGNHRSCNRTV
jgi:soluble lytic murein transglycosylase-like protein